MMWPFVLESGLKADMMSFVEPQWKPMACAMNAGEFLTCAEVYRRSHKRNHSFAHRTYAHDVEQTRHQEEYIKTCQQSAPDCAKKEVQLDTSSLASTRIASTDSDSNLSTPVKGNKPNQAPRHKKGQQKPTGTAKEQEVEQVKADSSSQQLSSQLQGRQLVLDDHLPGEDSHSKLATAENAGFTIMIRNLPSRISQREMLHSVDKCLHRRGLHEQVVLLYVPRVMDKNTTLGYGFVHLESKAAMLALKDAWHGKLPFGPQQSPINIAPAAVQGAKENIALWNRGKMSRIRNQEWRPLILKKI